MTKRLVEVYRTSTKMRVASEAYDKDESLQVMVTLPERAEPKSRKIWAVVIRLEFLYFCRPFDWEYARLGFVCLLPRIRRSFTSQISSPNVSHHGTEPLSLKSSKTHSLRAGGARKLWSHGPDKPWTKRLGGRGF